MTRFNLPITASSTDAISMIRQFAQQLGVVEMGQVEREQPERPKLRGVCPACRVGRLLANGAPRAKPHSPELRMRYLKCSQCPYTTKAFVEAGEVHQRTSFLGKERHGSA